MLPEPKTPKCLQQHVGASFLQGVEPPSSPWDNACILTVLLSSEHHKASRRLVFTCTKHLGYISTSYNSHPSAIPHCYPQAAAEFPSTICTEHSLQYYSNNDKPGQPHLQQLQQSFQTITAKVFGG